MLFFSYSVFFGEALNKEKENVIVIKQSEHSCLRYKLKLHSKRLYRKDKLLKNTVTRNTVPKPQQRNKRLAVWHINHQKEGDKKANKEKIKEDDDKLSRREIFKNISTREKSLLSNYLGLKINKFQVNGKINQIYCLALKYKYKAENSVNLIKWLSH